MRSRLLLLGSGAALLAGAVSWRPLAVLTAAATAALRLRGIRSRYVRLGSHRIRYFVGGKGEPLVLVHGLGGSALNYTRLMPALARRHRVFALDLLGYDGSDRPKVDYSVTLETEVLRQFLDSQGLSAPVNLTGWSMGGWVALRFAAQWPERVRRLILLDSGGVEFTPDFDPGLLTPHSMAEMEQLEKLLTTGSLPAFLRRDFLRRLEALEPVIHPTVQNMLSRREVMDGKLAPVTMPVLIVWGREDRLMPLAVGEKLHREMPQSRLVVLDGCGHLAPLGCHRRVLAAMQQFLAADASPVS